MDNSQVNIDLIRDHVDTIILATLANGDRYGLDILAEIKEKSKDLYELKQATLYSCLKRLEKLGYITSYKGDTSNGAQRVYYSILDDGRKVLETDQYQWEYARTIIDGLLSDKQFDKDKTPPFNASELRPRTKRNPKSDLPASQTAQVPESQIVVNAEENNEVLNFEENMTNDGQLQFPSQTMKVVSTNDQLKAVFVNKDSVLYEDKVDYREVFDNIFNNSENAVYSPTYDNRGISFSEYEKQQEQYEDYNEDRNDYYTKYAPSNIAKIFAEHNITMKQYVKKNTTEYYVNKYYYINKLLMTTSIYSYFIFAIVLTIMHLSTYSSFATPISSYLIPLFTFTIIPIVAIVNYIINPTKRVQADFSLKKTMSIVSVFLINAFLLIIIIGFLGFGAVFNNTKVLLQTVVFPIIITLLIPVSILIYSRFYNSNHYHVN